MINNGETNLRKGNGSNYWSAVAMLCTGAVLTTVVWDGTHDVAGFYQNLIIASTSLLIVAQDISDEISMKKEENYFLPKGWDIIYTMCGIFSILCFVIPLCVYMFASKNDDIRTHLDGGKLWGLCIPSMLMALFSILFLYLIPALKELPYKNENIRYEER